MRAWKIGTYRKIRSDIHARNTFEHRDRVMPTSNPLKLGNPLLHSFSASVDFRTDAAIALIV